MAYVYLKATEGGTNIDKRYAQNIALAKQYGLKVGSYHFYRPTRPQMEQLRNFRYQCQAKDHGPHPHGRYRDHGRPAPRSVGRLPP